ncbi:MAG TPA: type II glyceraldehyde-3-phosphate dehydrogenase [Anaerolineae bacterium]|nr:type II glyceraldehyde-3-phosphate dehydrogenase [Anaerolineae bacterium]HOQ97272.1 type II glyceraldehyde-3-phosphate dehydrogenase [Anaerolineae bacterium]HPL27596.1 type II glyceraldehyde-3-phosphate dehydrogenase [Anaerolineae bacterium]
MSKTRVAIAGYGTIGMRLADGAARQEDMELVGVADVAPTLAIRALHEAGMPYKLFLVDPARQPEFDRAGIPVAGTFDDMLAQADVVLDATPAGVGARNKALYAQHGVRAIFQAGEKNDVADVFFHGYANYEQGLGQRYLKLTSCNTTGLVRAVDALDRAVGVERIAITIIRRVADPGDTHRGLVDLLQVEKVPNHQALDLMHIMPHVQATGLLVHTPVTHGHIINIVATPKKTISPAAALDVFRAHPRIRVVRIADGFNSNAALFKYARDLGNKRGDMYEIGLWEECIGLSGNDLMFAINIPQEAVTIPETIDGVRAAMSLQADRLEAVGLTNKYLGIRTRN